MKSCRICYEIKTLEEFFRKPSCKDGYDSRCKSCVLIYQREYRARTGYEVELRYQKHAKHRPARDKVHYACRQGYIPYARDLICVDCGAQAEEYDHYLGYEIEHWLDVEPVCHPCHLIRTAKEKELQKAA